MGKTLQTLAQRELQGPSVFNNRLVTEVCEVFHFHYRNIRILLPFEDWLAFCHGVKDSFERWNKRGCPEPNPRNHIELCRKQIKGNKSDNKVKINLNKNLYNDHEGKIFAEGAGITEEEYIHLKIRDVRIELSKADFKEVADAVGEAAERLRNSDSDAVLQKA